MTKLDEVAVNIELILISIIEALALTFLAENAEPLMHADMWQYAPYILAGLTILLVFWAQAISHAISFIRWPIRMEHMLLYFVAVFLQVTAYSHLTDIKQWFIWWSLFSFVAIGIYAFDFRLIEDAAARIGESGQEYMHHIRIRHRYEFTVLVPAALIFNLVALALIEFMPALFSNPNIYAAIGLLQFLFSLAALWDCVNNFNRRTALLPKLFD